MDNRFEKLALWQKTHAFVLSIYKITKIFPKEEKYLLTDQLRRSSASIAANIVEGNEKKTKKDYINFLYIAKGSLSESKYFLLLSKDLSYISLNEYEEFMIRTNEIGKMINGLIRYLSSNTPI